MKVFMIAVKLKKGKPEIIRLYDVDNKSHIDVTVENIVKVLRQNKLNIINLKLDDKSVKGVNGSIDRYPIIGKNCTQAITILGKYNDRNAYKVIDVNYKIAVMSEEKLVWYANNYGISNGKVVNGYISAIDGQYEILSMQDELEVSAVASNKDKEYGDYNKDNSNSLTLKFSACEGKNTSNNIDIHSDVISVSIKNNMKSIRILNILADSNMMNILELSNLYLDELNISVPIEKHISSIKIYDCEINKINIISDQELLDNYRINLKECIADEIKIASLSAELYVRCCYFNKAALYTKIINFDNKAKEQGYDVTYIGKAIIAATKLNMSSTVISDTFGYYESSNEKKTVVIKIMVIANRFLVGTIEVRIINLILLYTYAETIRHNLIMNNTDKRVYSILLEKVIEYSKIEGICNIINMEKSKIKEIRLGLCQVYANGEVRRSKYKIDELEVNKIYNDGDIVIDKDKRVKKLCNGGNIILGENVTLSISMLSLDKNADFDGNNSKIIVDDVEVKSSSKTNDRLINNTVSEFKRLFSKYSKNYKENRVSLWVKFNSKARTYFFSNNIDHNIIDAEEYKDELNKLDNIAAKENMLGINGIDKIIDKMRSSRDSLKDNRTKEEIEHKPINTIPDNVLDKYELRKSQDYLTNYVRRITNDLIKLIKSLYDYNIGPLGKRLFSVALTDSSFRSNTKNLYGDDTVSIDLITFKHNKYTGTDRYIIVTNGNSLLHIGYTGDIDLFSFKYIVNINSLVADLVKIKSIDRVKNAVEQNITTNISLEQTSDLISEMMYLYDNTISIIDKQSKIMILPNNVIVKGKKYTVAYKINTLRDVEKYLVILDELNNKTCISSMTLIEYKDALSIIRSSVDKQYSKSLTLSILNDSDIVNKALEDAAKTEVVQIIPEAKVALIWKLSCIQHRNEILENGGMIEIINRQGVLLLNTSTLLNIFSTEYFKEITEKQYKSLKEDGKDVLSYTSNDNSKIIETEIRITNNKLKPENWNIIISKIEIKINEVKSRYYICYKKLKTLFNDMYNLANMVNTTSISLENVLSGTISCENCEKLGILVGKSGNWHANFGKDTFGGSRGKLARMSIIIDALTGVTYAVLNVILSSKGSTVLVDSRVAFRIRDLESGLLIVNRLSIEEKNRKLLNISKNIYNGDNAIYKIIPELQKHNIKEIDNYNKEINDAYIKNNYTHSNYFMNELGVYASFIASRLEHNEDSKNLIAKVSNIIEIKEYNKVMLDMVIGKGYAMQIDMMPNTYVRSGVLQTPDKKVSIIKYKSITEKSYIYNIEDEHRLIYTDLELEDLFSD